MSHQAQRLASSSEQMVGVDSPSRFMPISCCEKCIHCGTDAGEGGRVGGGGEGHCLSSQPSLEVCCDG